ncbi:transposase [Kordiimonas sp.]|uniref:transposase n=1 Tax=Kordiimonas sp. TaxID=1970157 RepID=UPI003B527419
MLVLASDVLDTTNDRAALEDLLERMADGPGSPGTLLADAGYAGEEVVAMLETRGVEALIAISREQHERPYDFRPPPAKAKPPKAITAQWRLDMIDKLQTEPARQQYRKRKQTVEPVFGIIKSILGFTRFHLRGLENVKSEWTLTTLTYNCKRLSKIMA